MAADKVSGVTLPKVKAQEVIARDQKGESLENIVEQEIRQQKKPKPTVSSIAKKVSGEAIGPSRLELWKKQRSQQGSGGK